MRTGEDDVPLTPANIEMDVNQSKILLGDHFDFYWF